MKNRKLRVSDLIKRQDIEQWVEGYIITIKAG